MDAADVEDDLVDVLFTEEQIQDRLRELARQIETDYEGQRPPHRRHPAGRGHGDGRPGPQLQPPRRDGLDGDLVLRLGHQVVSGVVRILKDLDTDISGRDVLIVDEIIDTGLTLSWLTSNLASRNPASVEICTLLRKPEALTMPVDVKYVGWDIPNEFVVGYGLDYRERYRNLRDIGTLSPHVYS